MSDDEILHGIRTVSRTHLGYEGPVTRDTVLVETLSLDSVRLLTLVVEIENHFRVNLEEGDEVGLVTVGDLLGVLRSRLG